MATTAVLLPGDNIPEELLNSNAQIATSITIGPGLNYTLPSKIAACVGGSFVFDNRKNAAWLNTNGVGRYHPTVGDLVLAVVHHSSVDTYHCALSSYTSFATLPQLAFEGVSKKTRPVLQSGSVVYARISHAGKHMDPELECVHPSTGKAEGLGELKDGMLFNISLGMSRRLMMKRQKDEGGVVVLQELADRGLQFEIAVGRNGQIWVNSDTVASILIVGKAIKSTDLLQLKSEDQIKLVRRLTSSGKLSNKQAVAV